MFQIQVPDQVPTLFDIEMMSEVADWSVRWLQVHRMEDVAPRLFAIIPKKWGTSRTVQEALADRTRISDIQGALTVVAMIDNVQLWDMLLSVTNCKSSLHALAYLNQPLPTS